MEWRQLQCAAPDRALGWIMLLVFNSYCDKCLVVAAMRNCARQILLGSMERDAVTVIPATARASQDVWHDEHGSRRLPGQFSQDYIHGAHGSGAC